MAERFNTTTLPEIPAPSPRELSASARKLLERVVENLLAFLDTIDPDPESEDAGDAEPSLGSTSSVSQMKWAAGENDDSEQQCEDEGAQCDDEGAVDVEPDYRIDGHWTIEQARALAHAKGTVAAVRERLRQMDVEHLKKELAAIEASEAQAVPTQGWHLGCRRGALAGGTTAGLQSC
jgi:hypothetical protein